MPSKAVAPMAPAPVQQPRPENTYGGKQRYITNLNPIGTKEYNGWVAKLGAGYDGGGWVSTTGTPGVDAATDDDLRAYAKAVALKGNTYDFGDMPGVRAAAAEFDAQQASQSQTSSATASPTKSYKDIKSISGGLKIGGDNILGRREASRISRNTGKSYDDVISKALGRGMSIGGGAVRQSNMASGTSQVNPTIKGQQMFTSGGSDDALSQMRRVNPGKRQMFSGTYQLDGQTMPLVESRRGGTNPMSISGGAGGRGRRGGKGRNRGGGMTDVGTGTGTGMGTQPMMDLQPMTPEQMQEASTVEGVGMLSGGGMGATGASRLGRARSRLRQLGIYGRGTSLLGRGLQYGNTLNA